MKKNGIVTVVLMVLSLTAFFIGATLSGVFPNGLMQLSSSETIPGIVYHAVVCPTIERTDGTIEKIDCSANTVYNDGLDTIELSLTSGTNNSFNTIALCNSSSTCGTPVAAQSETFTEYNGCGLTAGVADGISSLGVGNWSVFKTFTSTCNARTTNVTKLREPLTGRNLSGNQFTGATLQNGDKLTINWTIFITEGA